MSRPPVCSYEGSDYQASFWDRGGREYEDRAEALALKRLLPRSGRLLLELGAGAGRNTPRYAGFERVVLVDYSRTQLQQAQARLGNSDHYIYVAADIYRLPFAGSPFDAATMIRTLHHMTDAPAALKQVRAALAPGAIFILEYANKRNGKSIVRYWLGRQKWSPFTPEPVEFAELNFDFHPLAVRGWLHSLGFEIRRVLAVSHFRIGLLKRLLPTWLLVAMDGLLQPTGALWQLTPSVFVKAVVPGGSAQAGGLDTTREEGRPTPLRERGQSPVAEWLFKCPECDHAPLEDRANSLHCAECGHDWAFSDGIYDFREATKGI